MTKHLVRFGAAVMTTLLALVMLWQFRTVAVYLVASFALAIAVRPVVKHWARQGLALRVALILLYLVVLGGIGFFLFLAGRSALNEIQQMTSAAAIPGGEVGSAEKAWRGPPPTAYGRQLTSAVMLESTWAASRARDFPLRRKATGPPHCVGMAGEVQDGGRPH